MRHHLEALTQIEPYSSDPDEMERLRKRYDFIVTPFAPDLRGARVLDLASHDGRWAYALASTGARQVVGIEARQSHIDRFANFPKDAFSKVVTLRQGDIFEELERLGAAGETFDVITIYGIFYHITEHYRLILLAQALKPKLIIIDSEFIVSADGPIVRFMREDTDNDLNSISRSGRHNVELVATPSMRFIDVVGEVTGHRTEWVDWSKLPRPQRRKVSDYFRENAPRRRCTVALRPMEEFDPREKRARVFIDPKASH